MVRFLRDEKKVRFDSVGFAHLSRTYVYEFLVWLRETRGCVSQTLNLRLSAIKSFLRFCGEEDMTLMSVYLDVASIHAFKDTKSPCVKHLTSSQLKMLFAAPDVTTRLGRRDRFFLIHAYETGTRLQEILDLRCGSIIYGDMFTKIRILGKGSKVRYVPLLDATVDHLDAYLLEFHPSPAPDDYLFYTIHDSKHTQMKPGTADYLMKKYGKSLHKHDSTFPSGLHAHMLRHSVAMAMYRNGIPISYIRDFLGHSSVDTTTIYSHADEKTIAAALESIEHEQAVADRQNARKQWKGKEQYLMELCGLC
jgi:site-specific recombinase XerD